MKKFLSVLCLLGLLVLPLVACETQEEESLEVQDEGYEVEVEDDMGMETELDTLGTDMEQGMDEMGTDIEQGVDEMETEMEEPPAA
ncbi:MAG TPA: hypothetical protein VHQ65_16325 [Thermoanaerobaculia bacterium]|nr:hypothetical protein [Thermoanaerobaculia bacterium]